MNVKKPDVLLFTLSTKVVTKPLTIGIAGNKVIMLLDKCNSNPVSNILAVSECTVQRRGVMRRHVPYYLNWKTMMKMTMKRNPFLTRMILRNLPGLESQEHPQKLILRNA